MTRHVRRRGTMGCSHRVRMGVSMNWLKRVFTRQHRYDELSATIREHLEEKTADLMDRGMSREEAERTARRKFGNATLIEERSREVWQFSKLESIGADVELARRQRCSQSWTMCFWSPHRIETPDGWFRFKKQMGAIIPGLPRGWTSKPGRPRARP